MGLTNTQKVVLAIVVFIILLIGWGLFPLFFKWLMIGIGSTKDNLEDFGSMGDIYGSLNTLFTSATLLIVIYSTYLQRQANKDTREAMSEQLKQARDATAEQVAQAKESTNLQLLQAKKSMEEQLSLAKKTHDAQINETKLAFFTSQFYALLNLRNEKLKLLYIKNNDKEFTGIDVFRLFHLEFVKLLRNEWKGDKLEDLNPPMIRAKFHLISKELNSGDNFYPLLDYFQIYVSLFTLIKSSNLKKEDRKFFLKVISNSMNLSEQVVLFFIAPFRTTLLSSLENTKIFNSFHHKSFEKFGLKFHKNSHFSLIKWREIFANENK
ncbi:MULTISPECIES: hypothetical protein [Acinetobacter]|uniref:Uncharacterized protein n=1 Tax=Acinetobacter higginsii TaxID=70347 RepID=N9R587_9GAMM|nr:MULTISPECIES: hypothetical protein [Acinetobacter]ENX53203.1 hypothetical protein F902_04072 [Acinetobacter higginsii]ENX62945.1 hypothetical protein F885_00944 [Acinetobacter higginsii]